MSNRFTPAALAALSIAFASVGAQASEAQYCDGRLVARLFSSDVDNRGSMNVVTYWVQLQNTGGDRLNYVVYFDRHHQLRPPVIERQHGGPPRAVAPRQTIRIILGKQAFSPDRTGSPVRPYNIRNYTPVSCLQVI